MRHSLTGKVTIVAVVLLTLVVAAIITLWVILAQVQESVDHLTEHTVDRMLRAGSISIYVARAIGEAEAYSINGEEEELENSRQFLQIARGELLLLDAPDEHDLGEVQDQTYERIIAQYLNLLDAVALVFDDLETAVVNGDSNAIQNVENRLEALADDSLELDSEMNAIGRGEFAAGAMEVRNALAGTIAAMTGICIVLAIVVITALTLLRRQVVQPVLALAHAARQVADQRDAVHVQVTSSDEIGQLQRAFNQMVVTLEAQTAQLQQQVATAEAARQAAEAAEGRLRQQLATIDAQRETIRSMSIPILPLTSTVAVLPLIGAMDDTRLQVVTERILQHVAAARLRHVLFDITGVPVVDEQVADGLVRIMHSLRLLGAEAVLVGVRPEVAQALVHVGDVLKGIVTQSTLEQGVAYVLRGRMGV